jgi:hypothetical protein
MGRYEEGLSNRTTRRGTYVSMWKGEGMRFPKFHEFLIVVVIVTLGFGALLLLSMSKSWTPPGIKEQNEQLSAELQPSNDR